MRTLLMLVATLGLTACQTVAQVDEGPALGVRVNSPYAPNARLNLDTVVILDKALQDGRAGKLAVETSGGRRTPTGTLEIFAVIRNRTDYPQQIELRSQFFDQLGVPIEGPTAWSRLMLEPNGIQAYKEFSVGTSNVAHYYIEVREAF